MTEKLVQLDPPDCGCTECMIGLYKPLNLATYTEVRLMLDGVLSNATSEKFSYDGGKIKAEYSGQTWEPGITDGETEIARLVSRCARLQAQRDEALLYVPHDTAARLQLREEHDRDNRKPH